MHTDSTTAGQPGAPSCSNGQQATQDKQSAAALVFELVGVLLFDVAQAEAALDHLARVEDQEEHLEAVRNGAVLARQLAAFLADFARDGLTQCPASLTLGDCAGYLLSPEHMSALRLLQSGGQERTQ